MSESAKRIFRVTGLMSGTSLDGLDLAACSFFQNDNAWFFGIHHAKTYPYTAEWVGKLRSLEKAGARDFWETHFQYGQLIAGYVNQFHIETGFLPEFLASHGHTVFHEPHHGFTVQTGSGAAIAALTGLPVVCDFRSSDVCLGGQGAPLVPIGDELLFGEYDACLNLGGFSNISFSREHKRVAFDICPVNTVLNYLAGKLDLPYDEAGNISRKGNKNQKLFDDLNSLSFYSQLPPKSCGMEWVQSEILPLLQEFNISESDKLRTFTEHIAFQISRIFEQYQLTDVLVTGGGAHNLFLMELLQTASKTKIIIPTQEIIEFKEAMIFAFLGLLRWLELPNCLASATGARTDVSGGAIYLPVK